MSEHVCPDGHEVAALVAVRCQHDGCRCEVAYQPVSVGMALDRQLEEAVDDLREALDMLDNASSSFRDPALRQTWGRKRKALRLKWGQ